MDFTFTQFCSTINAADNFLIFKNAQIANITDKEAKDVPTMPIVPFKSGQLALMLMRPSNNGSDNSWITKPSLLVASAIFDKLK